MSSAAPSGSRLAVGSSSTRRPGRGASAPASASRCCWPPDSRRDRRRSRPARPTVARTSGTRARMSVTRPGAVLQPERDVVLDPLHDELRGRVLADDPDPRRDADRAEARMSCAVELERAGHRGRDLARDQTRDRSASVLLPDPDGPTTSRTAPGQVEVDRRRGPAGRPRCVRDAEGSRARSDDGSSVREPFEHAGLLERRDGGPRSHRPR